jgi:hypothetical protein
MARSWYGCALVAAICISTAGRTSQAQQRGAPPAAEAPPTAAALEARIETALGEVTSLQFTASPLSDVATYIRERHNVAIQLDTAALDTAGVTSDSPVTIDVEGVTLRSALNLMLKSIELTYCLQDGVLLITTPEEVDTRLVREVYDARHFLFSTDELGRRERDADGLLEMVMSHVQPTTWTDVGGTGAIEVLDQGLIVAQSWTVQQEVAQFVQAIDKAYAQHHQGNFRSPIEVGENDSSSTQAVRRALAEPTSLQFNESPLSDVVVFIKEQHKLQVQLDTAALDTAGITTDSPVNIDVEGVPLANSLNIMLKSIESTYVVRDEVLLITTPEEVDNQLITRIYPVYDLLEAERRADARPAKQPQVAPGAAAASPYAPSGTVPAKEAPKRGAPESAVRAAPAAPGTVTSTDNVEDKAYTVRPVTGGSSGPPLSRTGKVYPSASLQLVATVTATVGPTTWTDVGGTGAISYVPEFQGLVISQTDDVHAQIEDLFERMRKVALVQEASKEELPATDKSGEFSLKPYYLTLATGQRAKDVGAVSSLLQRVIEPGSWQANDGRSFIHIVDDALMIQATNATHERIEALLEQLDIGRSNGNGQGDGGIFGGAAAESKSESKPAETKK